MNKKVIVIVLVIVLALAAFFALKGKKDSGQTQSENQQTNNIPQDTSSKGQKSMKDFLSFSGSQKCTVSYSQEGYETSGTAYVANGKMRGDYSATVNGQTTKPQFISDGEFIYSWQEGDSQGFKMKMSAAEDAQTNSSTAQSNSVDLDQQVDYDCENWSTDSSKFAPPSNVKFTDYSEMMNNLNVKTDTKVEGSGSADLKAMQCAACDQAPPESKAQCLQALGCN